MTEVLDIQVDGEINDGADRRGPAWGVPAAVAAVGVLTLIVVVRIVEPGLIGHRGQESTRDSTLTTEAPTGTVNEPPTVASPVDSRVESARAALAAWGRFAASWDLSILTGFFAPDGPQYRLLAEDALEGTDRPGPERPYTVTLTDSRVVAEVTAEVVISTTATWERPGEPGQTFRWQVVLRPDHGGHWVVWTVRDQQSPG